ncbi:MAG TPA: TIR domain-containing protein [Longimicrobium sp.]|nr:TIR domain-containing protein [Longimicrobium sp.]
MRVFIGSSTDSLDLVRMIEGWVARAGHQPVPWNGPDLFIAGDFVLERLVKISRTIDAAILVFAEDARVQDAKGVSTRPRDNVLIEYGLFISALGKENAIVCVAGNPRLPTDLGGVVTVDISPHARANAETQVARWLGRIRPPPPRQDTLRLELQILQRMRHLGVRDPDVNLYLARLIYDEELARSAMERGGDPNHPLGELLNRHHEAVKHDRVYMDLLQRIARLLKSRSSAS